MKHCIKCGSDYQVQEHHVLPKTFFHGSGPIIDLCAKHHRQIESIISAIEHHRSGNRYGDRYQLPEKEYEFIANNFCRKEVV
jgi:hypothetical protein